MRTLDQFYWDCLCNEFCHCKNLAEALDTHPDLQGLRDDPVEPDAFNPGDNRYKWPEDRR